MRDGEGIGSLGFAGRVAAGSSVVSPMSTSYSEMEGLGAEIRGVYAVLPDRVAIKEFGTKELESECTI